MNTASAELRPQVVEALLMLPSQALLLRCHLENDLVIIIIQARLAKKFLCWIGVTKFLQKKTFWPNFF